MAWLQPTWRHSQLPPRCTHSLLTLETGPCSQFPRHRRGLSRGWWWVAWHLLNWYSRASDTLHISWWSLSCLHTWLAKRIHFARSSNECGMPHNVLHMVMTGIVWWSWCLLPPVHIFWASRQSRLWRGTVDPICGDNFHRWASSCSPLWYIPYNHKIDNICIPRV